MKEFNEEIIRLENEKDYEYIKRKYGKYPILLTSVHSMCQIKDGQVIKLNESFTKGLVKYIAEKMNLSYLIKIKDDGVDTNHVENDAFKNELERFIKENDIRLVLDFHGASIDREFDVELGTLDNLSADFSTIKELRDSFIENEIEKVFINTPFKGGMITQCVFMLTKSEAIQIEINKKYRDINNIQNIRKFCESIINFIDEYIEVLNLANEKKFLRKT